MEGLADPSAVLSESTESTVVAPLHGKQDSPHTMEDRPHTIDGGQIVEQVGAIVLSHVATNTQ